MTPHKLLLVIEDPFLATYCRETFAGAGFEVASAAEIGDALGEMDSEPGLVLLDPLVQGQDGLSAAQLIRRHPAGGKIPIVTLPTQHAAITERLESLPGVTLLTALANPLGDALKTAFRLLGLGEPDPGKMMLLATPSERWKERALTAMELSLVQMRQAHHELTRPGADHSHLRPYLKAVHALAAQANVLDANHLRHFALVMETLIFTLDQLDPAADRVEQFTLRTLGQANDFIAAALKEHLYARLPGVEATHVMVVEDEAPARELILTAMDLVGLKAGGAATPEEGITLLSCNPCDLIFLDINLPEMNGFEVCHQLRALPLHERTPIVFLTGMTGFNTRVQSSLSGGNDFICKPFNVAELGLKALLWVLKGRLGMC